MHHRPREGDRAADGYARARGGELVPPGLGGCGMRCTGAWAARGTRKGVHERSAVPRLGHRLVAKGSRTGDYRPDGDLIGKDRLIKRLPGVAVRAEILPNAQVLPDATDTATGANPLQLIVLLQDCPLMCLRSVQVTW